MKKKKRRLLREFFRRRKMVLWKNKYKVEHRNLEKGAPCVSAGSAAEGVPERSRAERRNERIAKRGHSDPEGNAGENEI